MRQFCLDRILEAGTLRKDVPSAFPDLLFEEELIDLGAYSRVDLISFGLLVDALDQFGVKNAQSYQFRCRGFSLVDCFALALASGKEYPILTGDKVMRTFAKANQINVHGVLRLVDRMLDAGVVTKADALEALVSMRDDPRSHVPAQELTRRIRQLSDFSSNAIIPASASKATDGKEGMER